MNKKTAGGDRVEGANIVIVSDQDGQGQKRVHRRDSSGQRGEVEIVCTCAEEGGWIIETGRPEENRKTSEKIHGCC